MFIINFAAMLKIEVGIDVFISMCISTTYLSIFINTLKAPLATKDLKLGILRTD